MNIHLFTPFKNIDWLGNITRVLENSIKDIGFFLTPYLEADVVIAVQLFPSDMIKRKGVKYILYQIEQYSAKPDSVNSYYTFDSDEIWGFDIENKKEKYVPLGYHPCLKFDKSFQDVDVSFMGCITEKRRKWFSEVKHNPKQIRGFIPKIRGGAISRTKINLNLHAYGRTCFTEWDRISHFLANGCFFISEGFYCPIDVPQFESTSQYDDMVEFYLSKVDLRENVGQEMQKVYQQQYDMRDILKGLL